MGDTTPTNVGINQYFGPSHSGLDLALNSGDPLYSLGSGQIITAQPGSAGYGNNVTERIGTGPLAGDIIRWAHLGTIGVQPGQLVGPGTQIGTVGNSGNSTGTHLHLELIGQNGQFLDPQSYTQRILAFSGGSHPGDTGATAVGNLYSGTNNPGVSPGNNSGGSSSVFGAAGGVKDGIVGGVGAGAAGIKNAITSIPDAITNGVDTIHRIFVSFGIAFLGMALITMAIFIGSKTAREGLGTAVKASAM